MPFRLWLLTRHSCGWVPDLSPEFLLCYRVSQAFSPFVPQLRMLGKRKCVWSTRMTLVPQLRLACAFPNHPS